jgi:transposase
MKQGVNAHNFTLFLINLSQHLPPHTIIILDNTAIHQTPTVTTQVALLKAKDHKFMFLPPYSPFLNPSKYTFSSLKRYVHHQHITTQDKLVVSVQEAITKITHKKAAAWYTTWWQEAANTTPSSPHTTRHAAGVFSRT